jgi:type IV pilus assembly protein PilB
MKHLSTTSQTPPIASPANPSRRLGEILVTGGVITEVQLDHALIQQRQLKLAFGKVLIRLNYATDERIKQALGEQLNVPYVDLEKMILDTALARTINRGYARRHSLLPIAKNGHILTVVMDDPTAKTVVNELSQLTGFSITVVTASSKAIQRAFSRLYDEPAGTVDGGAAELITPVASPQDSMAALAPIDEQTIRKADDLLRALLYRALENRTSDLHLEMLPSGLHVRYRIDGVLRQPSLEGLQPLLDRSMREIVSRVKILSKLDIAERRRPQDGSFQVAVDRGGKKVNIDLRVSVVPSYYGESVVIRILDRARAPRSLAELDLSPVVLAKLNDLLKRTTGILLVTGPTGSGKSTTMYSCLMKLHHPEIRILTAEDPVEYVYDELSQCEVNETIGNTFAAYLRAFLRHDPEVIMVGEIRDEETAEMAFRAAQTGHLLLSTLHTNSAIAALSRLIDLKIESSLIGSSLIGVISQRLVRKVCESCSKEVEPPPGAGEFFSTIPEGMKFFAGVGCEDCGFTGYKGRMMVADLWVPDDEDMLLITRQAPFNDIRRSAERTTFSMAQDAFDRLQSGRTTIEELLRVLPYSAITEMKARCSPA